jgi:hypothetical protein
MREVRCLIEFVWQTHIVKFKIKKRPWNKKKYRKLWFSVIEMRHVYIVYIRPSVSVRRIRSLIITPTNFFYLFLMALGLSQPLTEISTRNLPGGKGRPMCKADSLSAICEPIV